MCYTQMNFPTESVCTRHTAFNIATSVISCKKSTSKITLSLRCEQRKAPWLNIDFCLCHKILIFLFYSMRINKRNTSVRRFLIHVAIADAETNGTGEHGGWVQMWIPPTAVSEYLKGLSGADWQHKANNLSSAKQTLVPKGGALKQDV